MSQYAGNGRTGRSDEQIEQLAEEALIGENWGPAEELRARKFCEKNGLDFSKTDGYRQACDAVRKGSDLAADDETDPDPATLLCEATGSNPAAAAVYAKAAGLLSKYGYLDPDAEQQLKTENIDRLTKINAEIAELSQKLNTAIHNITVSRQGGSAVPESLITQRDMLMRNLAIKKLEKELAKHHNLDDFAKLFEGMSGK